MEKKTEISILIPKPLDQLQENLQNWIYSFAGYLGILLDRILPDQTRISVEGELSRVEDDRVVILLLSPDFSSESEGMKTVQKISDQDNRRMADSGVRIQRVFKVCLSPVPSGLQPEFLRGYSDYLVGGEEMNLEEISFDTGIKSSIWSVLVDLAYDISHSVLDMQYVKMGKPKEDTGPTIFLAEATPHQKENRDALKRELIQFGYNVVPYQSLTGNAAEIEASVNELLKKASFAIHIVGNEYGDPLSDSEYSLVDLQLRISAAFGSPSESGTDFQRIIWFPPDLKPADEKQKQFVEKLVRQEEALKIAEIVQTPLELLKSIVRRRISRKDEESDRQAKVMLPEKPFVYLIHEKEYEDEVERVLSWFKDRKMSIISTGMTASTENIVSLHQQYLAHCSGVLIHYSGDNLPWISSKMKDLLKAPGFGRAEPIKAMAVMVQNGDEFNFAISNLDIIPLKKGATEVNFDNFLEKINQ